MPAEGPCPGLASRSRQGRSGAGAQERGLAACDGLTYADIAGGPDVRGVKPFHEVRLARGTKLGAVCLGSFVVSWAVKSMGPEFK